MRQTLWIISLLCTSILVAQSTDFTLGHPVYGILELEEIKASKAFNTTIKPVSRVSVYDFFGNDGGLYLNKELREYTADSSRSSVPILGRFFQYPADLIYYEDEKLDLHVNPVLQFSYGKTNDALGSSYVNSRGIEIRGRVDKKVAFYSMLTENQARYPEYVNDVRDSTLVVPYEGFWKQFDETGVDFFRAQGYIDFGLSQSISAQLGFGKHFVGNGIRSLILSNYSNNYPYLRINTTTKIFDYTNIFAEQIAGVRGGTFGVEGSGGFQKKYMAFHHLNVKIKPNLHIGLFESVMYGDSTSGLKLEYLNPVIFYRAVEQQNGSEDNAIIGLDFKWNIKNYVSLYGQLVIDEMIIGEVFSGDGWWGNKQGFQLGVKYVDPFGVENLMIQGEVNRVRPYMYAHEDGFTSYSHYNLSLAHPLGANFTEYLGRVSYRMNDQWSFEGMIMAAKYGNDIGDVNYGRDILKDYTMRRPADNGGSLEFGNEHLQGNKTDLVVMFFRASFMARHNLFLDADITLRKESDSLGQIDTSTSVFGLSLRWNVPSRRYLF
ncbi:hypothetical protein SAMN05421640_0402 [Ekhidna lutea]|uniref:Capsule assembly protein Wzi n=1 Tax=Ekhidna lutea TaxID=447679 RepID=A0A239EYZ4_EKHLU|nr:hypothetical protein [Ekhidna lutea]SNS49849.1 hypothetical protein SAMN05421640_0402 [Ekhidna lutea]